MAGFMTILLILLLFELEITVLNCNQFSPLITLISDYFLGQSVSVLSERVKCFWFSIYI